MNRIKMLNRVMFPTWVIIADTAMMVGLAAAAIYSAWLYYWIPAVICGTLVVADLVVAGIARYYRSQDIEQEIFESALASYLYECDCEECSGEDCE